MQFQIKKVILWAKKDFAPRVIELKEGQVNVISGASKTGKSAVIPIIDYCLCSNKCSIPVGVIREECAWFGIVISTSEGEKLLARREPGEQIQTSDMFILESSTIEISNESPEKNSNTSQVKKMLNRLAGLSSLGLNANNENSYSSARVSFRDLMAFTFQPQNIVANPDVLFYKADTTEHREKLKAIFPYILNAVNQQTMLDRWELDRALKQLRQKERALSAVRSTAKTWVSEAKVWIQNARELGLITPELPEPQTWGAALELLKTIAESSQHQSNITLSGISSVLDNIMELNEKESIEASNLSSYRQRLLEIERLISSSESYGDALLVQRDRLEISSWIKAYSKKSEDPLSLLSPEAAGNLSSLCSALNGLELELQGQTTVSDKLDKERLKLRGLAEQSTSELNSIKAQKKELERSSEEAKSAIYRADQIQRYLGRLEQALNLYENSMQDSELKAEVIELQSRASALKESIDTGLINSKISNSISTIEGISGKITPLLDAEWPDSAIKFLIDDLTIKVIRGTRDDYLWEIGSGANWLAYHISISLAFQRFFLQTPAHAVPNFLVYDQPSQVYFPKSPNKADAEKPEWQNQDVIAVRKIFTTMSQETLSANGNLQIIVLDHADDSVWGDIHNVELIEEWRPNSPRNNFEKLVPKIWTSAE